MLTSMLEQAIEIEGLLRIIRDGDPHPETYTLLKAKSRGIAELAEKLQPTLREEGAAATASQEEEESAATSQDFVMESPTAIGYEARVVFESSDTASALPNDDFDLTEEDDIILTFDEQPEEIYESPAETADLSPETTPTTETIFISESEQPNLTDDMGQLPIAEEETHITGSQDAGATGLKTEQKAARHKSLKSAFTLNDRFLYSRELFGGNMKLFDSTIAQIEGAEDFRTIEEFFFEELGWSQEDQHVASFMERLKLQF